MDLLTAAVFNFNVYIITSSVSILILALIYRVTIKLSTEQIATVLTDIRYVIGSGFDNRLRLKYSLPHASSKKQIVMWSIGIVSLITTSILTHTISSFYITSQTKVLLPKQEYAHLVNYKGSPIKTMGLNTLGSVKAVGYYQFRDLSLIRTYMPYFKISAPSNMPLNTNIMTDKISMVIFDSGVTLEYSFGITMSRVADVTSIKLGGYQFCIQGMCDANFSGYNAYGETGGSAYSANCLMASEDLKAIDILVSLSNVTEEMFIKGFFPTSYDNRLPGNVLKWNNLSSTNLVRCANDIAANIYDPNDIIIYIIIIVTLTILVLIIIITYIVPFSRRYTYGFPAFSLSKAYEVDVLKIIASNTGNCIKDPISLQQKFKYDLIKNKDGTYHIYPSSITSTSLRYSDLTSVRDVCYGIPTSYAKLDSVSTRVIRDNGDDDEDYYTSSDSSYHDTRYY
jgi:hypothetical protein